MKKLKGKNFPKEYNCDLNLYLIEREKKKLYLLNCNNSH